MRLNSFRKRKWRFFFSIPLVIMRLQKSDGINQKWVIWNAFRLEIYDLKVNFRSSKIIISQSATCLRRKQINYCGFAVVAFDLFIKLLLGRAFVYRVFIVTRQRFSSLFSLSDDYNNTLLTCSVCLSFNSSNNMPKQHSR